VSRKRGIPTYLWVLNKEADFRRAEELGVAGIMTDYPARLKHFLNNNHQPDKLSDL
jgi:glycerophosphoryl diester phosphodiesterase